MVSLLARIEYVENAAKNGSPIVQMNTTNDDDDGIQRIYVCTNNDSDHTGFYLDELTMHFKYVCK